MSNTFEYYDLKMIGKRLSAMRKARYKLYKDYMDIVNPSKQILTERKRGLKKLLKELKAKDVSMLKKKERDEVFKKIRETQEELNKTLQRLASPIAKPKLALKYSKYKCCKNQTEFADYIKISRPEYCLWEKGARIPTIYNLVELCNILDCSMDYLLGGDDRELHEPYKTASFFSKIDTKIIEHCRENDNYRDFLNFMMNPERCEKMVKTIDIIKKEDYCIKLRSEDIGNPLMEKIKDRYSFFIAINPIDKISISSYKKHLDEYLEVTKKELYESLPEPTYKSFFDAAGNFNKDDFIDFIANNTYEQMKNSSLWEAQKSILTESFRESLQSYIDYDVE